MREITILLPDSIPLRGMPTAPAEFRVVSTANWTAETVLAAVVHGVSQKICDPWNGGKGEEKMKKVHAAVERGEWTSRERTGASLIKFDEAIKKLNVETLAKKLSKEQLLELAALIKADNEP